MEAAPELQSNAALVYASQDYLADRYAADVDRWGEFDADRWAAYYEWLNDNDLTDGELAIDAGFTNDYLPEA